jgi:hypothetical protein
MNNYQLEELENILRNARKGKGHLEVSGKKWEPLDCFIQIIDIVERIKKYESSTSNLTGLSS